jgi:hypothetical protein
VYQDAIHTLLLDLGEVLDLANISQVGTGSESATGPEEYALPSGLVLSGCQVSSMSMKDTCLCS